MTQVRFLKPFAGRAEGQVETIATPRVVQSWVSKGIAEVVENDDQVEASTVDDTESVDAKDEENDDEDEPRPNEDRAIKSPGKPKRKPRRGRS